MADLTSNNTQQTATNLGTLGNGTDGTLSIYETDSVNPVNDAWDYFRIDTVGLSQVKIDIEPIGFDSNDNTTSYSLGYGVLDSFSLDYGVQGDESISVNISSSSAPAQNVNAGVYGESYNENNNYFIKTLDSRTTAYNIFDGISSDFSSAPHLVFNTNPGESLIIGVNGDILASNSDGTSSYQDLSYLIDVTPISSSSTSVTSPESTLTATETHLLSYNVTMDQAKDFLMENLSDLSNIHTVCKTFGVTNDMISEILASEFTGLTGEVVANYFASNGIDTTDLGGSGPTIAVVVPSSPVVDDSGNNSSSSIYVKTSQVFEDIQYGSTPSTSIYTYTYDASTHTASDTDGNSYVYNTSGNLVSSSTQWNTVTYEYDSQGRVSQKLYNSIDTGEVWNTETYTWTSDSVTIAASDSYSGFIDRATGTIDSNGNITTLEWAWGVEGNDVADQMETFTYDSNGNELTKTVDNDLDGIIDYQYTYQWDLIA